MAGPTVQGGGRGQVRNIRDLMSDAAARST